MVADLDNIKIEKRSEKTIQPILGYGSLEWYSDGVNIEEVEYIIVPEYFQELAEEIFFEYKDKIIAVGMRKATISYAMKDFKEVGIPDYESVVRKIAKENPYRKFWAHGIRLPLRSDIFTKKSLEKENAIRYSLDEAENLFDKKPFNASSSLQKFQRLPNPISNSI